MSASCSIELWTAMPLATKLWVPRTVASKTCSTPSGSIGHDLVPEHVVDRHDLQLGSRRALGHPPQSLARGGVLPHRRPAERGCPIAAANCAVRHALVRRAPPRTRPHTCVGTVSTLVFASVSRTISSSCRPPARRGPRARRSLRGTDAGRPARDVERVARRGTRPCGSSRTRVADPEAQQQPRQSSTRRRLVEA